MKLEVSTNGTHHENSAGDRSIEMINRKIWVSPAIVSLPRLTELTLQSIPCGGEPGSTVCP